MGKAIRKPRPSMPRWWWIDRDGCWGCKNTNNCNQCKGARAYTKEYREKKVKGINQNNKKGVSKCTKYT